MEGRTRIVVATLAIVAAGAAVLAGATAAGPPAPEAPVADVVEVFAEDEWTISTPTGWTRRDVTRVTDAAMAVRYEGPSGEYFIVAIDPLGSGYAYDRLWHYRVIGDRFEVTERLACAKGDEACSDGDERYTGVLIWERGSEPVEAGGHTWYFMFGDDSAATVDEAEFERIAESIRVKR